jgi:hypothetical protein
MRALGGGIAGLLLLGPLALAAFAQPGEREYVMVAVASRPGTPQWLTTAAIIITAIFTLLTIFLSHRIDRHLRPDGVPLWQKPLRIIPNIFSQHSDSADVDSLRTLIRYAAAGIYLPWILIWDLDSRNEGHERRAVQAHMERLVAANIHSPGTVFAYTLTNTDKSDPEPILVRIAAPFEMDIAHFHERCRAPAFAKVAFDPDSREATTIAFGRLQRDGGTTLETFLIADADGKEFALHRGSPQSTAPTAYTAPPSPWRLYNLSLADFIFAGPRQRETFTFGLLADHGAGGDHVFRNLGEARADYWFGSSSGKLTFNLSGPAFTGPDGDETGGLVVIDETHGHVIRADLKLPAHAGRTGFRLRLDGIHPLTQGEIAWRNILADHWQDCPP